MEMNMTKSCGLGNPLKKAYSPIPNVKRSFYFMAFESGIKTPHSSMTTTEAKCLEEFDVESHG